MIPDPVMESAKEAVWQAFVASGKPHWLTTREKYWHSLGEWTRREAIAAAEARAPVPHLCVETASKGVFLSYRANGLPITWMHPDEAYMLASELVRVADEAKRQSASDG